MILSHENELLKLHYTTTDLKKLEYSVLKTRYCDLKNIYWKLSYVNMNTRYIISVSQFLDFSVSAKM